MSTKLGCEGPLAFVAGVKAPALSISWAPPADPDLDSGYIVFMAECSLDVPDTEWPESQPVCLHCLVDDGGEQLGAGLDLARRHGQVDFDLEAGEWHPAPVMGGDAA